MYGREYYASVLPNHTVQYVKPPSLEVDCGPFILLQPVPEEGSQQVEERGGGECRGVT